MKTAIALLFATLNSARADDAIKLYVGFVTRVRCEDRLLLSSIGDDRLIRLEALPRELGCGVVLKPSGSTGRTNLILETSTGTIRRILIVSPSSASGAGPDAKDLDYQLKGVQQ